VRYERARRRGRPQETPNLPPLLGHPYRLVQLFSNLILNAYQGDEGPGLPDGEASAAEPASITVRIGDTGPGIPTQAVDRSSTRSSRPSPRARARAWGCRSAG
jgi:signal transduction histidine kinase